MDEKFLGMKRELQADIDDINARHDYLEGRIDTLERESHSADLLLNGIPITPNEDLNLLFNKICTKLGFAAKDYTLLSIFRLKNKFSHPTIVLKFISQDARNAFYKLYWKSKNLNLIDVGFQTDSRIYVKESLTKSNLEIFQRAMALRREKKLYSVLTYNGCVYVKNQPEAQAVRIDSVSLLTEYNKRKLNNTSDSISPLTNDAKVVKTTLGTPSTMVPLHQSQQTIATFLPTKTGGANFSTPRSATKRFTTGTLDQFISNNK